MNRPCDGSVDGERYDAHRAPGVARARSTKSDGKGGEPNRRDRDMVIVISMRAVLERWATRRVPGDRFHGLTERKRREYASNRNEVVPIRYLEIETESA